ncbi:alpha-ketoglutarate-dependent dioxygenase AlkB [Streptomyces sp. NPDC048330]|uniref:alpha-ketoglutarate-dependent dioxygenase AlkB n=1 Tax=Streptomyces sp. NPDC048330 TaxID=3365533 RepID=UPI00370FAF5B
MPPESRIATDFPSRTLPLEGNLFAELSASTPMEDVGKGRRGAVLAKVDAAGRVPLVRTTSRYSNAAQRFRAVHERLAQTIRECAALPVDFNNALIERYTNAYTSMGSHSDQALDLAEDSFIAVFSCYENPGAGPPRKLVVESKTSGTERFEIPLTHHSVVTFSVDANRHFKHKIVLDKPVPAEDNPWLGVTFRTSKTLLRFREGVAHLPDGRRLTTADDEQAREFYRLRRRENNETDFVYPTLTYTISESDLLPPA